jgi:Fur family transcriptional regulator, zinc uptake regulator
MTPLSKAVLTELKTAQCGIKAHALAKILSDKHQRTVAPNSVYRALKRLENDGFVRKIVSTNAFFALDDLSRQALCLLSCSICGEIGVIQCRETGKRLEKLAEANDFTPKTLVIEIIGNCAACEGGLLQPRQLDSPACEAWNCSSSPPVHSTGLQV